MAVRHEVADARAAVSFLPYMKLPARLWFAAVFVLGFGSLLAWLILSAPGLYGSHGPFRSGRDPESACGRVRVRCGASALCAPGCPGRYGLPAPHRQRHAASGRHQSRVGSTRTPREVHHTALLSLSLSPNGRRRAPLTAPEPGLKSVPTRVNLRLTSFRLSWSRGFRGRSGPGFPPAAPEPAVVW